MTLGGSCSTSVCSLPIDAAVHLGDGEALGNAGAGGIGVASGIVVVGALVGVGATSAAFAEAGNLSAFASKSEICHIWVSESDLLNPGMPLRRMPFAIFQ